MELIERIEVVIFDYRLVLGIWSSSLKFTAGWIELGTWFSLVLYGALLVLLFSFDADKRNSIFQDLKTFSISPII